jgi:hypothetical protein
VKEARKEVCGPRPDSLTAFYARIRWGALLLLAADRGPQTSKETHYPHHHQHRDRDHRNDQQAQQQRETEYE